MRPLLNANARVVLAINLEFPVFAGNFGDGGEVAPVFKAALLEETLACLVAFVNVGNDRLKVELFFDLLVGKCEEPTAETLPMGAVVDVDRNFCCVCVSGVEKYSRAHQPLTLPSLVITQRGWRSSNWANHSSRSATVIGLLSSVAIPAATASLKMLMMVSQSLASARRMLIVAFVIVRSPL